MASASVGYQASTYFGPAVLPSAVGPTQTAQPVTTPPAATPAASDIEAPVRGATNQVVSALMPVVR